MKLNIENPLAPQIGVYWSCEECAFVTKDMEAAIQHSQYYRKLYGETCAHHTQCKWYYNEDFPSPFMRGRKWSITSLKPAIFSGRATNSKHNSSCST